MIRTIKRCDDEQGKEKEGGQVAQKPKCRRRVLLHRAGYKSPGYKRALAKPPGAGHLRSPCASIGLLLLLLSHGSRPNENERMNPPFGFFFFSVRKARSRRHEAADLNDRTYGRRRSAFVAELRMPVTARSVIFKGPIDLFSPRKITLVGESGSADCDVNSRARIARVRIQRMIGTELFRRKRRRIIGESYYFNPHRFIWRFFTRAKTEEISANEFVSPKRI